VEDIENLGNRARSVRRNDRQTCFRIGLVAMEEHQGKDRVQGIETCFPTTRHAKPVAVLVNEFSAAASCPSCWIDDSPLRDHAKASPVRSWGPAVDEGARGSRCGKLPTHLAGSVGGNAGRAENRLIVSLSTYARVNDSASSRPPIVLSMRGGCWRT
jgi:hypothetical protein